MIELFVEKKQVDVNEVFSTLLTLAIDDIKDFGSKNTTYSKTVVLPGTKNNNKLFGNIFDVGGSNNYNPGLDNIALNFNPAIGAKAIIFSDNMQIFKGIIRMLEVIVDDGFIEYEVAVFGELGGFVAKLGNLKLEDLDFSAHNTTYTLANIIASWDNTPGSGIYFPLMDYGTYSVNKHDWQYNTFRPALYAKEYIDKIFAATGYSYNCDLFNTDRFKRLVNPHNTKDLRYYTSNLVHMTRSNDYLIISDGTSSSEMYAFETFVGSSFSTNANKDRITYFDTPPLTCQMIFDLSGIYMNDAVTIEVSVMINGVAIATYGDGFDDTGGSTNFLPWNRVHTIDLSLVQNDYIEIRFFKTGASRPFQVWSDYGDLTIKTANPIYALVPYGGDIIVNDILPKNILQKDYFSSILKLFNCYVFEDYENEKTLNIKPFVDYYIDAEAEDWSSKIDRSKPIRITPLGELNARYYEFKLKKDSDFYNDLYDKRYNQTYGSYIYDSEFEFVAESKKIELIFAGTPIVGYTGEEKVYSTIFKRTGETTLVEEKVDSVLRILQTKKITGVTSWDIVDGASVLGSYTYYGYAGHLDDPDAPANDINFGVPEELFFALATGALNVNQFNVYWSAYMAEITDKDSKLLKCTAYLYSKDIYQINFATLIYIDGSLFRINSIKDFNATKEDTCQVELLKIINRIY